jgi:hypothetical protein
MFLHFGSKRVDESKGYVADFCPICRQPQRFQFFEASIKKTFNGVTYGRGKFLGRFIQCQECRWRCGVDSERYARMQREPGLSTEVLIEQTFPNLRIVLRERLALEEKVQRSPGSLSRAERATLLMEPFEVLSPMADERSQSASTTMDKTSSLGCLGTAVIVGGLFFFSALCLRGRTQDKGLIATLIAGIIGVAYCLWLMHWGTRRFISDTLVQLVVRALKPLHPTREELMACLQECHARGYILAKEMKVDELWRRLH